MSGNIYGLTGNPFDKNFSFGGRYFESDDLKQVLSRLNLLKTTRGIGMITAPPGMGKSMALKVFADSLNLNQYRPVYISFTTVTVPEFYRQLSDTFGITDVKGKTARVRALKEQIAYTYKEKRQTVILILDEAQYLNQGILNDLQMLMNFDYDSKNCFALVLSGEPYLNTVINKPVHAALKQRILVHYEYNGLSGEEVKEYIFFKLKQAGGTEAIVDPAAISVINGYAGGDPRIIDNIMYDSINIGEQQNAMTINIDIVRAAAQNRSF